MVSLRNNGNLIGRLVKDPELRKTASDITVCNFSIAVDRPGTNKDNRITDFFDCVAWRQTAESICKFFHQGDPIGIHYSLQTDSYTDNNGNKRKKVEICVDSFEFMPKAKQTEVQNQEQQTGEATNSFQAAIDADELPF